MAPEMQFEDQAHRDEQNSSFGADEERTLSSFDGGFAGLYGGKLLVEPWWRRFFVARRLTLALVSLLTFAGILLMALPIAMDAFIFSLDSNFVKVLVYLGLYFYLALAFVLNILFHRRGNLTLALVSLLAFAGIFLGALQVEIQIYTWSTDFVHGLFILGLIFSLTLAIVVNVLFRRVARKHISFSSQILPG